jgi:hypothetical protein
MNFVSLQKHYFNSRQKPAAAIFTGLIALILVTPLCGFLFDCGCTWPWSGLDSKCNSHRLDAAHHCPWCASLIAGWVSVALSIISGVMVSVSPLPMPGGGKGIESASRILCGTLTFLCVATAAAWLAAESQDYPLGIFGIIHQK